MRSVRLRLLIATLGVAVTIGLALGWLRPGPGAGRHGVSPLSESSTQTIPEALEWIAENADVLRNPFVNDRRAEMYGRDVALSTNLEQRVGLEWDWASELLNAGETTNAIAVLENWESHIADFEPAHQAEARFNFRRKLALARLRQGEQENCVAHHTIDSCLLPIAGSGIHALTRGSQAAFDLLSDQLKEFPDDLQSRWLLMIASMTLGNAPEAIPEPWRIPPSIFDSEHDIKRFYDISSKLGLDIPRHAGGSIVEDFDLDGFLDVMTSSMGLRDQLRFFRNQGDGTFSERTKEAGLTGEVGGLHICQADYNNDGFPDVLVLRGGWMGAEGRHPKSLLRNRGDGTFENVTRRAGLFTLHPTQTAAWFDYDSDGWLDLFIGNESSQLELHPCELFHNNRDGTFTECAREAGVAITGLVKGAVAGDYNKDARPDLYVSRRGQANILLRNDGPAAPPGSGNPPWTFTDVAEQAGVAQPIYSFPTWFFDYDNDGWLDLFVAGYSIEDVADVAADYLGLPHSGERARLYRNLGNGTFADVSKAAGLDRVLLAMGSNYGDLDNDGFLDFYLGTGDPNLETLIPNRMFRNAAGARFQDVTTSGGFGHVQKGHGVSFADLDNDGDQDIHAVIGGAYTGDWYRNALFENPGHGNHWLTLEIEGTTSNRHGVGATLRVVVDTPTGERSIYKQVTTGGSFGASPLRQEIGLGDASGVRLVEVFWPVTRTTQAVHGLLMDRFYKIREGDAAATQLVRRRIELRGGPASHDHSHGHEHKAPHGEPPSAALKDP